ncbi:MAG: hypothetical protein QOD10_5689, partial [Mycobacterium sp.]|nr:hypothetical protein [Mycobacterium sp.]
MNLAAWVERDGVATGYCVWLVWGRCVAGLGP